MTAPVLSMPASLIRLDPQGASTHAIRRASSKSADGLKYLRDCWTDIDIFVDRDTNNETRTKPKRLNLPKTLTIGGPVFKRGSDHKPMQHDAGNRSKQQPKHILHKGSTPEG